MNTYKIELKDFDYSNTYVLESEHNLTQEEFVKFCNSVLPETIDLIIQESEKFSITWDKIVDQLVLNVLPKYGYQLKPVSTAKFPVDKNIFSSETLEKIKKHDKQVAEQSRFQRNIQH